MIAAFPNSPFNFAPPPGGDPDFASVSLLLHCDGTNGSTTFIDSTGNNTMTAEGSAQVTTTGPKFGTGAMVCASGNRVRANAGSLFDFGTGDFTIEAQVNPDAGYGTATYNALIGSLTTIYGWGLYVSNAGNVVFYNTNNLDIFGAVSSPGNWSHVAVSRASGTLRCFVNGTLSGSALTRTGAVNSVATYLGVGWDYNVGNGYFIGKIDEVRVTKGVARYTSDFTAPTQAFPDS